MAAFQFKNRYGKTKAQVLHTEEQINEVSNEAPNIQRLALTQETDVHHDGTQPNTGEDKMEPGVSHRNVDENTRPGVRTGTASTSSATRSAMKEAKEFHTKETKTLVDRVRAHYKEKKIDFKKAHQELLKRGIAPSNIDKTLREDGADADRTDYQASGEPSPGVKGGKTLTGKPKDQVEQEPQIKNMADANGPSVRNGSV